MQITDIRATPVTVPLEAPIRWSMGVETGTTRTIIEIFADTGQKGIGETYGGNETVAKVLSCKSLILGEDPYEMGRILSKFLNYFTIPYETSIPLPVYAGIEMALWDLNGKILDRSVSSLLGDSHKKLVECCGYPFWRYRSKDGAGGESTPEDMVRHCRQLVDKYGFKALKLKGGVLDPAIETRTVHELRRQFGEDMLIRFDVATDDRRRFGVCRRSYMGN